MYPLKYAATYKAWKFDLFSAILTVCIVLKITNSLCIRISTKIYSYLYSKRIWSINAKLYVCLLLKITNSLCIHVSTKIYSYLYSMRIWSINAKLNVCLVLKITNSLHICVINSHEFHSENRTVAWEILIHCIHVWKAYIAWEFDLLMLNWMYASFSKELSHCVSTKIYSYLYGMRIWSINAKLHECMSRFLKITNSPHIH
jgi:hypothetical protein